MSKPATLLIPFTRNMFKPSTGKGTVILALPPAIGAVGPDGPAFHKDLPMYLLAATCNQVDEDVEDIRCAEWWVTRDPDVVIDRGDGQHCATCLAGVDQAVAALKAEPELIVAVGLLDWCAP